MALQVYNTLIRAKEPFVPLRAPHVGMYVCGPTVYGHSHIGHAKSYLSFDTMVRWLRYSGYEVTYVQNITDVGHLTDDADEGDDKLIIEARRRGLHPMAIAELFTTSYLADMDALGLLRPDIQPRATGHIPEQIGLCQELLARGHAYEVNGSVYYDVTSFAEYGKLSGRRIEEMESGSRVAVLDEKHDPRDFALWKAAEPGHIMQWHSPWGMGYPGWHVECSAMSAKYLGQSFDIHGGGLENQFPHHECEIAQSEGASGQPFVRYWLHNHMVTVNGEKMGKSKGNFVLIKDVINEDWPDNPMLGRKYDPLVLRLYVLSSHYRSDLDFTADGLAAAEAGLRRLHTAVGLVRRALDRADEEGAEHGLDLGAVRQAFAAQMDDDFGAPGALASLFDFARQTNDRLNSGVRLSRGALDAIDAVWRELGGTVLGLVPSQLRAGSDTGLEDGLMELLITTRREARLARDFALADRLRDQLTALGVVLEDTRDGTTWRRA